MWLVSTSIDMSTAAIISKVAGIQSVKEPWSTDAPVIAGC